MAHVALGDHGFYFGAEDLLQTADEVDLEFVGILKDSGVEQDLVGLAETEVELVLVEQLFVGLPALLAPHAKILARGRASCRIPLRA